MKLSLNWIKQYTDVDVSTDELVKKIGAQLGEVEGVEDLGPKYKGAVIVKVVSCEDHPNADRLHVCRVDDGGAVKDAERGEDGLVQVVCGAPNVHKDMLAVWLPPGVTVPDSHGTAEPFVLEARDLRGVVSNGMLASPKELALGDSHEGILEIDDKEWSPNQKDIKPGADFAKIYGLDDTVIEIENKMFTHRPDLFGQLGLAREVAGINNQKFTSPDWYAKAGDPPSGDGLELDVTNEVPELVPRLTAVAIKGVEVKPSPLWLQCELIRVGAKPVNNVVDVTNYIMLLTAQPTHAYDYDKLRGHKLLARTAKPGEKLTLLNHKTYQLTEEDIVIADAEGAIGLGGIMGGGDSEVSDATKNIVLECANFDMYAARRSSMRHGIFTDALARFNKGQSPLQNANVLSLLIQSIHDVAGGEVASKAFDLNKLGGRQWVHPPVPVTAEFINARLGLSLKPGEMKSLLENVEMRVELETRDKSQETRDKEQETGGKRQESSKEAAHDSELMTPDSAAQLLVTAPFWRTDIETREDVVEEVGRLYGYDKLPLQLPTRSIKPAPKNDLLQLKDHIRENLVKSGANEVLAYSFVHGNLLDKAGQDKKNAFKLSNALSPDLQYYRLSLMPSLLDKVHANIKAGYDQFALFEIGSQHAKDEVDDNGLPKEMERLSLVVAAKKPGQGAAYYLAKNMLDNLLSGLGVHGIDFEPLDPNAGYKTAPYYDPGRGANLRIDGRTIGRIGEFKPSVRRALKLPDYCAGFEIHTDELLKLTSLTPYHPLPRFPKITQDITLKVPAKAAYSQVYDAVWQGLAGVQPEQTLPMLEPLGIYQAKDDPAHKNITLRFTVASYQKTMTDAEVATLLDAAAAKAKKELGAERI